MKTVYLGGPVTGCTQAEANAWRDTMQAQLIEHGIRGISPLRGITPGSSRYRHEDSEGIAARCLFDVQRSDVVLCFMPMVINERTTSFGTLIELAWARAFNKPAILVTDDPALKKHPLVRACAGWCVGPLDEAVEILVELLADRAVPQLDHASIDQQVTSLRRASQRATHPTAMWERDYIDMWDKI